jgi:hypothetical protein
MLNEQNPLFIIDTFDCRMEGFAVGRVLATVVWCFPPISTHSNGDHLSQGSGIKSTYVHINEN